jgi:hypothetical protein
MPLGPPLLSPVLVLVLLPGRPGRPGSHSPPLLPVCLGAVVRHRSRVSAIPVPFVHSPSLGPAIPKRRGDIPPDQKSQTSRDPTVPLFAWLVIVISSAWLGGESTTKQATHTSARPMDLGTVPWH